MASLGSGGGGEQGWLERRSGAALPVNCQHKISWRVFPELVCQFVDPHTGQLSNGNNPSLIYFLATA